MARVDVPESWYHIVARGQRREALFLSASDRLRYLSELARSLRRYQCRLGAYCLMPNHVHLLIYRTRESLGRIFLDAHGRYGRYFNRRHNKVGYVFQGRFKSYLVLLEDYLDALVRYIHENPVKANLARSAGGYVWSSDRFYRGSGSEDSVRGVLSRVPGYEGRTGSQRYSELMGGDCEEVPRVDQYIGDRDDLEFWDRRTRGRKKEGTERRGVLSLSHRVKIMEREMGFDVRRLRSDRRTREISGVRQQVMAKLYSEGYPVSKIAELFAKTPAAVLHSVNRS